MIKFLSTLILVVVMVPAFAQKQTYILVHGAWHGAWCWNKVVPILKKNGHDAIALDLPGHGNDNSDPSKVTFDEYIKRVIDASNRVSGNVILVGHSMAGVVIAQAAEQLGIEKVSKLIFLDAFMPKNGESVFMLAKKAEDVGDQQPTLLPNLILSDDQKTSTVKVEAIKALFYDDCEPKDVEYAISHLGPQPMVCLATPVSLTEARYGAIPKYYILCTESKDLDKTSIAMNVPLVKLFKLKSSHSPFFSMPEKLSEILLK